MQPSSKLRVPRWIWVALLLYSPALPGQTGFKINIPKPKEYEERVLRSEKSTDGKLRTIPKFIQNTVTHYNFTYNASRKLNEVIDKAKAAHKDDYSKLISFYNYSPAAIKADSVQLDSVIQKASSGIALHDLRNDWVDNLYLLWGAAYYFQQKFDSAYQLFQFINYSFAPKEKDGYYKVIGSGRDGNRSNSIASQEKNNPVKKIFSEPPSRNDAFIWQIRNHLAQDEFAEASSIIDVLKKDPAFPKRLQPALEEVMALQFYKIESWDSAALHLSRALPEAGSSQERARWEYLIAQLYEKAGKNKEAHQYYLKVIPRTTDLILEIYARLGSIRTNQQNASADINKNVGQLLQMASQDRYLAYRDIIYYMAAQMDLAGGNTDRAILSLLNSTKASSNSPQQRNKAFLQLADLSYQSGRYKESSRFYDSIQLKDSKQEDVKWLEERKKALRLLAANLDVLERQDSLLRIAALPEEERKEWARKLLRELRRQQGISEDAAFTPKGNNPLQPVVTNTLFMPGEARGEWYFYNAASRSRGQSEFKNRWGNRPNSDNWRRLAALQAMMNNPLNAATSDSTAKSNLSASGSTDFETIYNQLPLREEQKRVARDSISNALFNAGKLLIQEMEDCPRGVMLLERLLSSDTAFRPKQELYVNLYRCYQRSNQLQKAKQIQLLLQEQFPNDPLTIALFQPGLTGKEPTRNGDSAYQRVYELFAAENYEAALSAKKIADSTYGASYWTPQLLYIESIYYVKQRQDSTAIRLLNQISNQFSSHPLAARALALVNALRNRGQLEASLLTASSVAQAPLTTPGGYTKNPQSPHLALLVLSGLDSAVNNQTKNALAQFNRDRVGANNLITSTTSFPDSHYLISVAGFSDAAAATLYKERATLSTRSDIAPWLQTGQFYWIIISASNWERLKEQKDLTSYKNFIKENSP